MRLASKQAAASKQARPSGPLADPRATGVPKSKKCYHAIQDGVGTTNNHLGDPEGPCPGRPSAPSARVAVPRAGPKWDPKRPKMA